MHWIASHADMPCEPPPAPQRLEIHVFGAGKGESILVGFPDSSQTIQRWGVIDYYAPARLRTKNPILNFLRQRDVQELAFLSITHPDEDHYLGMHHLLTCFKVERFWSFVYPNISDLMMGLRGRGKQPQKRRRVDDLEQLLLQITKLESKEEIERQWLTAGEPLSTGSEPESSEFSIQALAPPLEYIQAYRDDLQRYVAHPTPKLRLRPNHISGAFSLTFGATHLILGGDAEEGSWEYALNLYKDKLISHAVKGGHHGSENGYCQGFWGTVSQRDKPFVAFTPYKRYDLPSIHTIRHIRDYTSYIMATCLPAVDINLWDTTEITRMWENNPFVFPGDTPEFLYEQTFLGLRSSSVKQGKAGCCSLAFDRNGNVWYAFAEGAGWLVDPNRSPSVLQR